MRHDSSGNCGGGGMLVSGSGNGDVLWCGQGVAAVAVAAAWMRACGSDGGWTPSPTFREQPLEREETPFLFSNDG